MFPFANVFDFFADEFAGLSRRRFSFAPVAFRTGKSFSVGHREKRYKAVSRAGGKERVYQQIFLFLFLFH
jgi:hypothetical protein